MFKLSRRIGAAVLLLPSVISISMCSASTPFLGSPFSEPNTQINAVDFDNGSDGDAFHVGTNSNNTNYRTTPVPISTTADPGRGFAVGNGIGPGDWVAYSSNFTSGGTFDISIRAATANTDQGGLSGRFVHVEVDNVNVTGSIDLPATSDWNTYKTGVSLGVSISSGAHKIKLVVENPVGLFNVNWMTITPHVAKTYYVSSSSGSDANTGLDSGHAIQTLAKMKTLPLGGGDTVLFKRGDEWHESMQTQYGGQLGAVLTYADYGTGNKPKFWGSNVMPNSAFTSIGNNQYTYNAGTTTINSVLLNHNFLAWASTPNTPNTWNQSGSTVTIDVPTNPNTDGNLYTGCVRVDEIQCLTHSHLVFRNLVADETALFGDGYDVRAQNAVDVLFDGCEAYRGGKHNFGCIDSTQVTFNNCYAAYEEPGQGGGGATEYVSFSTLDPSGLNAGTSTYTNCVADHVDDGTGGTYPSFVCHGAVLGTITFNNFITHFGKVSLLQDGNDVNEKIIFNGGLLDNANMEIFATNSLIDGARITGNGCLDLYGGGNVFQNLIMDNHTGFPPAVLVRSGCVGTVIRFSTIVDSPSAPANNPLITLQSSGSQTKWYGNILMSTGQILDPSGFNASSGDVAGTNYNLYNTNPTFTYGGQTLSQWQGATGADVNSTTGNPLFVNQSAGNYALQSGSPAIHSVPLSISYPATDFNGSARPNGTSNDRGAVEFGGSGPAAPVITSAGTASGTLGSGFSYQIIATNTPTSYGGSSLPAGTSVNTGTGLISGTPTTAATYNATVTATNSGGTGSKAVTITISTGGGNTPYNIFAYFTLGTAVTNGGADSFGDAYEYNLLPSSAAYNGSTFTFPSPNVADAWSNTTVTLPAGSYTTLNMLATATGGNVTSQTFTVHYTDGTTSTFTQSLHDWGSTSLYAGETVVVTMANRLVSSGQSASPAAPAYIKGYTFALNGKAVQSITLPASRQVIAFGFAAGGAAPAPVINSSLTASGAVGAAFSYTITATNSPTSYNATGLPAGLSVNTGTGVISGTPTTPGTSSVTISATNAGGTGSATLALTVGNTATAFNVFGSFTVGTAVTNGGLDSFSAAYEASLLGTSATFNGSTFTFGPANAADAWSNTTVNLPAGNYTTLNMLATSTGGNVTAKTFTVNYTDGTTSVFTQSLHDWTSSSLYTGETIAVTMANRLNSAGAVTTPAVYLKGYTFTLNGKSVQSITLPASRQVVALGFAVR